MGKKEVTILNNTATELTISEDTIKNYFCKDATSQELALGAMICKQQGLNPFTGDVHFVKYGKEKMQIIVSKYAFLKRAERNPNYDGFKAWTEKENNILVGKCEVYRKDRKCPFYGEAWFDEYKQNNKIWNEKPKTMIRKVAIVQTLREAFADELGGLYTVDEMPYFDHEKYPNYNEIKTVEVINPELDKKEHFTDYHKEVKKVAEEAEKKFKEKFEEEPTEECKSITPTEIMETSDGDIKSLFKEKCIDAGLTKEEIKFFAKRNNIKPSDVNSIINFLKENDLQEKVNEFKDEDIPF